MAEWTPIDYTALVHALLKDADELVRRWLPGGVERNGRWYVGDFDGGTGESANVNLATGQWIDNAAPEEDVGRDLLSLYARIHGMSNSEAARELIKELGLERSQVSSRWGATASTGDSGPPEPPPEDPPGADKPQPKKKPKWQPIVPVPKHAPAPRFVFGYKNKKTDEWVQQDAVRVWTYEFEQQLYGHVARFERISSDGELVKDTVPLTWCRDTTDDRGSQRWAWKAWDAPRPLYVPATLLAGDPSAVPVVVVEGEKCALAGHELLGHEFDFVSWPGGCKTWAMAAWGWLMGRTVYLWPDCDAKRVPPTAAERKLDEFDPNTKPLLAEARQPGMKAMVNVGSLLLADQRCTVFMCAIPQPGGLLDGRTVPDGWDIADAVADGWDAARVRDFVRSARPFVAPDDAARAKARSTPTGTGVGTGESGGEDSAGGDVLTWRDKLLTTATTGAIKAVRENIVLALDGMQHAKLPVWLEGIAEAKGVIAFNDFTNDVVKLKPTPWGTSAGVWEEHDELEMGYWLTRSFWLPSMPRGTLEEAVAMVAKRHRFHPVRDELERVRGKHDGTPRLATWLARCCLAEDEHPEALQQYLARVGTWLLMAICARVLTPGCKFDYMVILEGAQGVGKSTLARLLGWEYFADTGLVLGDKDSYQNLQGVLVYEWGELDSLTKSEVTKVKQFISSQKDRFRASFDRRPKDYPRQVVFIGTTNEDRYLVDQTGNRRMWPVRCTRQIDVAWFAQHREQLLAEALALLDAGQRFHPTLKEQRQLFDPQQKHRQVENAIESAIRRYLYDENQKPSGNGINGWLVTEVTVSDLLTSIGISVDRQTNVIVRQATAALRQVGWEHKRSGNVARLYAYHRPRGKPQADSFDKAAFPASGPTGQDESGGDDDAPF